MKIVSVALMLWMLSLSFQGSAEEMKHGSAIDWPVDVKPLLIEEMQSIQTAMQQLIKTMAIGDWDASVTLGKQIQSGFLMKNKLTRQQKQQLHQQLPSGFIELDKRFHDYAGMLADAAQLKNAELMSFYFYKMHESCLGCHAQFARERFPALQDSAATDHAGQH